MKAFFFFLGLAALPSLAQASSTCLVFASHGEVSAYCDGKEAFRVNVRPGSFGVTVSAKLNELVSKGYEIKTHSSTSGGEELYTLTRK